MRLHVVAEGVVFAGKNARGTRSCAFPAVCTAQFGRWLAACQVAPTKESKADQHVLLTWSDNEGRSWQPPIEPFKATPVNGNPGLFRALHVSSLGGGLFIIVL